MAHTPFRLGYITKFSPPAWLAAHDQLHGDDWWTGAYFVDLAQRLEASYFDFLFFEDTQAVIRRLGDSTSADLKHAIYAPKHDPMPLLGQLAGATEHIGLIATASTSFYPPFMLARLLSTLDSMSGGRVGWNIVTSALDEEGANYGLDALPPGSVRYDRAEDFVELALQLWESWDADALLRDVDAGIHVDPARVREIAYEGPFYRSRGPLNTLPSPQRRPVLAQAGSSDRGRDFAAKYAEVIFGLAGVGVEAMARFRHDIHRRMEKFGRDPREVKIYWDAGIRVTHPDDDFDGQWRDERIEVLQTYWSAFLNVDMSQFDLDEPFPQDVPMTGISSMMEELKELGRQGKSLRESLIQVYAGGDGLGMIGPADEVAANLVAAMDEVGGDGFMIRGGDIANADFLDRITKELVPRLQDLGVVPTAYGGSTLRETLRAG